MTVQAWTYLFVGLTFALYLGIAWWSRVRDTQGFYVAGRGVPAAANGMATAADWMSAASFISMAGLISTMGYAGGVYLMGWTGGFVLLSLLLAPYLRKFGHYTVPDFVGDRYDSRFARIIAVLCALFVSFTYVAGQMRGVGVVFSRFLEVDVTVGVVIGMIIVFIYATLGGMKGITWTQVAQYWVLITAFLVPAIAISLKLTGTLMPQAGLGANLAGESVSLLARLDGLQRELGFGPYTDPFVGKWDKVNVFFVALALMVGTAGLPHVIVRFYTVKSPQAARWSGFWALFFIAGLYLTAPAVAGFARYYMLESLNGTTEEELPGWFHSWESTGLILWYDDGDGRIRYSGDEGNEIFRAGSLSPAELSGLARAHQLWLDSAGAPGADARVELRAKGLSGPDRDIIVLATPEMAELADWIIAFVAAGGLAAALSTASGLLLVISSSVAHDLYYKVLNPRATEQKRLLVGRATLGVAGIGLTGFYIVGVVFFGMEKWTFGLSAQGIDPQGIGTIGMLVNFGVTILLTPLFPAPDARVQELVDKVREPEGWSPAVDIEDAPEH